MDKADWSRRLSKPIDVGRRKLRTLHDVRAHLLKLPEDRQHMVGYQRVAHLLMQAADGGEIADIPLAFRLARALHR